MSVRPSVPRYFQTTKNAISCVPMTTKFDKDQERVDDNSKMSSECQSVGLSVLPTRKRKKERKKERKKKEKGRKKEKEKKGEKKKKIEKKREREKERKKNVQ